MLCMCVYYYVCNVCILKKYDVDSSGILCLGGVTFYKIYIFTNTRNITLQYIIQYVYVLRSWLFKIELFAT